MKIILQPEARSLSNREIAENQQYLINLAGKIKRIKPIFRKQSSSKNSGYSCN